MSGKTLVLEGKLVDFVFLVKYKKLACLRCFICLKILNTQAIIETSMLETILETSMHALFYEVYVVQVGNDPSIDS